jgi:hypothetical protein
MVPRPMKNTVRNVRILPQIVSEKTYGLELTMQSTKAVRPRLERAFAGKNNDAFSYVQSE